MSTWGVTELFRTQCHITIHTCSIKVSQGLCTEI